MATTGGTTDFKAIFSFFQVLINISLVTYSATPTVLSHNSFMFCIFLTKQCIIQTPKRKISGEQGGRAFDPIFLTNNQESTCPKWHKHDRKSEVVVHHLTKQLFLKECDVKQHPPS
jgi:hypothetical protein